MLSAAIALSATTVLGKLIGGAMLRTVRSFRTGDFIRVEVHFGRVSARGLFHTEIQDAGGDMPPELVRRRDEVNALIAEIDVAIEPETVAPAATTTPTATPTD